MTIYHSKRKEIILSNPHFKQWGFFFVVLLVFQEKVSIFYKKEMFQ
jgi:hypothetical protein